MKTEISLRTRLTAYGIRVLFSVLVPVFCTIMRCLSEKNSLRLAPIVGRMLRLGMRETTMTLMEGMLSDEGRTSKDWLNLWNAHVRQAGQTVIEPFLLRRMSNQELLDVFMIEGEEYLREALDSGRGAMVFANHLGNLGSVGATLGTRGYNVALATNVIRFPQIDQKLEEFCQSIGVDRMLVGDHLPLKAGAHFRRNGVFVTFIDHPSTGKKNTWLHFGNVQIHVNMGPALLAIFYRVPILCTTAVRLSWNRHRLIIHPPLRRVVSGYSVRDATELTQQAISVLASDVRRHPEQWWQWSHVPVRLNGKVVLDDSLKQLVAELAK